jgi:membrane protease YdiL (CAAX protease family)
MTIEAYRENHRDLKGVGAGFIIILLLVNGGEFLFNGIYQYFSRDFVPIIYLVIIGISILLTNCYMFFQYRFLPVFTRTSLKESLLTSFGGMILIWIVVAAEVLLYFGNRSNDPFIRQLISLPSLQFYMGAMMIVIVNPFLEEVLFRGFFFEILKGRWNTSIALLVTVSFSSVMHYRAGLGIIHVVLTNIIFTVLYLAGGLVPCILGHAFVNYYSVYFLNIN